MAKKPVDQVLAEIDRQVAFLVRCRAVFPRLARHLVGQTSFDAPPYYRQHGHDVEVQLAEPMTEEFIDDLNRLAHWLNENFILRLWAVLDSNGFYKPGIEAIAGQDEMDITRRLRNMIGHGGFYDPDDRDKKRLYDRIVQHFHVDSQSYIDDPTVYPLGVAQVLVPLAGGCKRYVVAFQGGEGP
jgi:hypothetical protein